jgi:hypothetical protein
MSTEDDDRNQYHSSGNLVHVGPWALEVDRLWASIDEIERSGIPLDQIGLALAHNWTACVVALARKNLAILRALIAEASP